MTIPYAPTTVRGVGFLPCLVRATHKALHVVAAVSMEWPITAEQAKAELQLAMESLNTIQTLGKVLSDEATNHLNDWLVQTQSLSTLLGGLEAVDPEMNIDTLTQPLKDYLTQTWALLSIMDKELLGLDDTQTDPGQRP